MNEAERGSRLQVQELRVQPGGNPDQKVIYGIAEAAWRGGHRLNWDSSGNNGYTEAALMTELVSEVVQTMNKEPREQNTTAE